MLIINVSEKAYCPALTPEYVHSSNLSTVLHNIPLQFKKSQMYSIIKAAFNCCAICFEMEFIFYNYRFMIFFLISKIYTHANRILLIDPLMKHKRVERFSVFTHVSNTYTNVIKAPDATRETKQTVHL